MAKTVFKCNKCGSSSFIIDRKPDYTTICCANKKCGSSWFIEHPKAKVQTCPCCKGSKTISVKTAYGYLEAICGNCMGKGKL